MFTACSKFQPTVLEGQLCYSLNLSKIQTEKSSTGKRAGLVLVLDQGIENNENLQNKIFLDNRRIPLDLEESEEGDGTARIYLSTLSSFTDHRAGSYGMSALKKITGTKRFMEQTDDIKMCQVQSFEECQTEKYLENVQKKCGCVPWALTSALPSEV